MITILIASIQNYQKFYQNLLDYSIAEGISRKTENYIKLYKIDKAQQEKFKQYIILHELKSVLKLCECQVKEPDLYNTIKYIVTENLKFKLEILKVLGKFHPANASNNLFFSQQNVYTNSSFYTFFNEHGFGGLFTNSNTDDMEKKILQNIIIVEYNNDSIATLQQKIQEFKNNIFKYEQVSIGLKKDYEKEVEEIKKIIFMNQIKIYSLYGLGVVIISGISIYLYFLLRKPKNIRTKINLINVSSKK